MGTTDIEWTRGDDGSLGRVWNPVTGCTKVSAGCKNCYAERIFQRPYPGRDFTDVRTHEDRLDAPLHWRKPSRIFVNSMSDLFHEKVSFEFILAVLAHAVTADRHTYQILTKRPARMLLFQEWMDTKALYRVELTRKCFWWGVSVEDQETANVRIPWLLQFRGGVRWVSYEPALGRVDFTRVQVPQPWVEDAPILERGGEFVFNSLTDHDDEHYFNVHPKLDWIVCGGESGPGARPMHPGWARSARDQCQAAGVPYFFKQWGQYLPAGCDGAPGDGQHLNASDVPVKVGKHAAGRLLDGRTWDEFPAPAARTEGE